MLRVLVLATRFPDRLRPNLGIFIEQQTLALAARPGVSVEVVAPVGRLPFPLSRLRSGAALDALPQRELWRGIDVHRPRFVQLPFLSGARAGALSRRLVPYAAELRRRFAFDVVCAEFSWPEGPAAVAVGRALDVPAVIKARGMDFDRRVERTATRSELLDSARAAQALLAVSADVKERMVAAGLPSERIRVHYPGVDSAMFRPRDQAAARQRLRVSGPLLLAVGNLIPEKRQRLAVEALALIEAATLIIVGTGPERERLLRLARELGVADRLRMPGSVPHALLPTFFDAADVTVHCSAVEGFGNVRLESLACGTPLVTTPVGEAKRIVDRPEAGRIVPPEPGAIAAAVRELLAAPPAPASVRRAVADFTWERNVAELESHLRRAVDAWRSADPRA